MLASTEAACRQACCLAPVCHGYSFDVGALRIDARRYVDAQSSCYLYINITQLVPSSGYASGIRESVLL